MSTSLNNHIDKRGATPEVSIVDWGRHICVTITFGEHSFSSFVKPREGQSTEDLIIDVKAALLNVECKALDYNKYTENL